MIINFPDANEFEELGKEWLHQSFELLINYGAELDYIESWDTNSWHFHKGKISTILILLHQSVESKLKADICKISPFFLLDLNTKDWPTLPASKDKSFDELFTIGSESLIRVYCGLIDEGTDKNELVKIFNEVRINRNKIVHNINRIYFQPNYLINLIFVISKTFYKTNFWEIIKSEHLNHPFINHLEEEEVLGYLFHRFEFIKNHISKREFNKLLEIKGRAYHCLNCLSSESPNEISVYLKSKDLAKCLVCDKEYKIIRHHCWTEECKGDVIYESRNHGIIHEVCLTCLEEVIIDKDKL